MVKIILMNIQLIIIFLIILVMVLAISLFKVTIKVVKKEETNVDLIIGHFRGYRIDLDEMFEEMIEETQINEIPKVTYRSWEQFQEVYPIIRLIMRNSHVKKVTVIPKLNVDNLIINNYLAFSNILLLNWIKNYLDRHFKSCNDEYYQVIIDYQNQRGLMLEITVQIGLIPLLRIIFANFQSFKQLIKREGSQDGRTSH